MDPDTPVDEDTGGETDVPDDGAPKPDIDLKDTIGGDVTDIDAVAEEEGSSGGATVFIVLGVIVVVLAIGGFIGYKVYKSRSLKST